jgi:co-chaperonin GroES (HSP10)
MIQAIEDKIVTTLMKRTKSVGGLILPETSQEPQAYGKVISVGDKAADKGIKEGDIIVSHIRSGMDSVIGNKFIKVLKLEEVYGVLTDQETLEALETIELQSSDVKPEKTSAVQSGGSRIIRPV